MSASADSSKSDKRIAALAAVELRSKSIETTIKTTTTTTTQPEAPQIQSRIGDKFSKIRSTSSAFTGSSNKLK